MLARSSLMVGVVATLFSACRPAPTTDVAGVQAKLDSVLAAHARYAIQEDVEGLLTGYTETAVVRSNHGEPIRGRAALRTFATAMFQTVDIRTLSYHTEGLAVYGDSAWQIITYQMAAQPTGMREQPDHGSGMALWVRDASGAWHIQHDILNSSVPLPQSAAR